MDVCSVAFGACGSSCRSVLLLIPSLTSLGGTGPQTLPVALLYYSKHYEVAGQRILFGRQVLCTFTVCKVLILPPPAAYTYSASVTDMK